jgi:predicted nucleic-acid-binding Zn-ribbon protein
MRETFNGFKCSRCGNELHTGIVEVKQMKPPEAAPIDVISNSEEGYRKVSKACPRCGNSEAFRSVLFSSGEHAGVRQERSLQRLTCTKCRHSWTED